MYRAVEQMSTTMHCVSRDYLVKELLLGNLAFIYVIFYKNADCHRRALSHLQQQFELSGVPVHLEDEGQGMSQLLVCDILQFVRQEMVA